MSLFVFRINLKKKMIKTSNFYQKIKVNHQKIEQKSSKKVSKKKKTYQHYKSQIRNNLKSIIYYLKHRNLMRIFFKRPQLKL